MARQYDVDDSKWPEVEVINGYALFMGYLMMGVRGLGLLIITWTTVVLLGGFVSDLGKKDFWCLTGITLIQTAGVFNFLLTEKLNDMVHLSLGLTGVAFSTFLIQLVGINLDDLSWRLLCGLVIRLFLAYAALAIQGVVLFVILCPVFILYVFGIYISTGASLWRLIKHDFRNDGDGGANMKPALQVLYSLAVAQGVLFGYKTLHAFAAKTGLVKLVYNALDEEVHEVLLEEYLEETVAGCEKDPSFANGRNLVTYGVDLMMEAKSNEGFIAGIKVLGGAINEGTRGRKVLAKYLLARSDDSSSAIIQRLLKTVASTSLYSRRIKLHVVSILDIIAPYICLEQFPRAIEYLCCVVDTSEESSNKLPLKLRQMVNEKFKGHREDREDDEIEDIDTYAILKKYKDARCEKIKDYERVELLEKYERKYIEDYIYDEPIALSHKLLFRIQWRLYRCLPCGPLIQRCLVGKREPNISGSTEENSFSVDQLLIIVTNIIHKLVALEDNGWILRTCVSNTVLLKKIAMFPTKLHSRDNHYNFYPSELKMLEQCKVLTERLLVALTETTSLPLQSATTVGEGRQRRSEEIEVEVEQGEEQLLQFLDGSALRNTIERTIQDSIQSTIKRIFDCLDCPSWPKKQAIQILLHLSWDMSFIMDSDSSKRRLSWVLLLIFCSTYDNLEDWMVPSLKYRNKNCCDFNGIRKLAGEKLSEIMLGQKHELPSEESARELLLQSIRLAHQDLESAFNDDSEDTSMRQHARIIQAGLSPGDYATRLSELQGSLVDAVPEIVTETSIPVGPITAESPPATDLEMGIVTQDIQDGSLDIE